MKLLCFEANSVEMVDAGMRQSAWFERAVSRLDPSVELTVMEPYRQSVTDADFADADAIIFTGSGVQWNVNEETAKPQQQVMDRALATKKPIWGSCNGMQLAAFVLGGQTGEAPNGFEDGLAKELTLTAAGRDHPMFAGRDAPFAVACIHRDEVVALPTGAIHLAENSHTRVQAFSYEADGIDFWGTQYHPEYTLQHVARVLRKVGRGSEEDHKALENNDAATLGVSDNDLQFAAHVNEFANWLRHAEAKSTPI